MYYSVIKKTEIITENGVEIFDTMVGYDNLFDLLKENPNIIEYYICDDNHVCSLIQIENM